MEGTGGPAVTDPRCARCRRYPPHTDGQCRRCLLKAAGWVRTDRAVTGESWSHFRDPMWVKFETAWRKYRATLP